jgi:predicted DNA-binding transcriptional regulator YafY
VNRTDRLYAVVEELRAAAPRPRSARQLARKYEVSTRTIERDILALQDAGVPVYAETGRLGGYVIDPAFTLPPVNFTAPEMVAIAVSLARADGTPFAYAARSALRKVLAAAPASQLTEAAELMDRIRLIGTDRPAGCGPRPCGATGPGPGDGRRPAGAARPADHVRPADGTRPADSARRADGARPDGARPDGAGPAEKVSAEPVNGQARKPVPLAIQEAITTRHVLLIDYRDRHGTVTAREVEPVALAGTQAHWYLMGWCRLRGAARAFRMDRIVGAVDIGEPAPHRSYADLKVDIPHALVSVPDLVG